ncbi:MAG TPA: ABC transporter ATP-binding protein [Polyangiales bacterium]|jgi:ABC-2 type transport system ATP-binding protein|nr:ABC transporter ATP-binding protein [Polyangiales bacterium]
MSEHAIQVDKLSKHFGDFVAVRDVSFHVERGEIFGYLGANGAGKSTTIRMLCGLLAPSGGHASVAGHDVASSALSVKSSIGYMSQKFSLYLELEAQDNLEFFAGIYGLSGRRLQHAIDEVVERTGLREHKHAITGALPGGIRQRLALACSLIHKPAIVFLDEPTAGVDPGSRRDFWRLIRALAGQGTTVFVTTHYMDEAEYCARIGLMVDGVLVALDTPDALKRTWVPGEAVSVEGRDLHKAVNAARKLPDVRSAELFGAHLHVRFDEKAAPDRQSLTQALTSAGASVESIEPTEASLEDVFLAVARTSKQESD